MASEIQVCEFLKEINGLENCFISEYGNVYKRHGANFRRLKFWDNPYRAISISIRHKNERPKFLVKRLVATHFVPNSDSSKTCVINSDGNKYNNHYSNLRWVTLKEAVSSNGLGKTY